MQRNSYRPLTLLFFGLTIGIVAGYSAARLTTSVENDVVAMPQLTASHFPELIAAGIDGDQIVQTNLFTYATEDGPRVAIVPQQDSDLSGVSVPYPNRLHRN